MYGAYLPVHCLPVFVPAGNLRCPQGWGEEQQQQSRAAPRRARRHLGAWHSEHRAGSESRSLLSAVPQAAGVRPQDGLEARPRQSGQKNEPVKLVNLVQLP